MRTILIPKKSGGYRKVVAPSKAEKAEYRKLIPDLVRICRRVDKHGVMHGFMPNRSAVTNAMAHVGDWEVTISMDLKNFFDSVDLRHFYNLDTNALRELDTLVIGKNCFPTHQGLPTSPVLANIAFSECDTLIVAGLKYDHKDDGFVYTRYADDLTISIRRVDSRSMNGIVRWVSTVISDHGFAINKSKTSFHWSKAGRRRVTGVMVDDKGIYPTRETKERLRAAIHQKNTPQINGLMEWCKLKLPFGSGSMRKAAKAYKDAWADLTKHPNCNDTAIRFLIAKNSLHVAAYVAGLDPDEAVRRSHECK